MLWALQSHAQNKKFVWRTDRIHATIERDDQHLKIGQFLYLAQDLEKGETGWLNMKINIPEDWNVHIITVGDGLVRLETVDSGVFELNRNNVGKLSFAILDGGDNKPDEVLEKIWIKHAANAV